jgi:hypothetical protein
MSGSQTTSNVGISNPLIFYLKTRYSIASKPFFIEIAEHE